MKKLSKRVFSFVAAAVILVTTFLSTGVFDVAAWQESPQESAVVSVYYYGAFTKSGYSIPLYNLGGGHISVYDCESYGGDVIVEGDYLYLECFAYAGTSESASASVTLKGGMDISYDFEVSSTESSYTYLGKDVGLTDVTVSVGDTYTMAPDVTYIGSSNSCVRVSGNTLTAVSAGSASIYFHQDDTDYHFDVTVEGSSSGGTDPGGTDPGGSGSGGSTTVTKETIYETVKSKEISLVQLDPVSYTYEIVHESSSDLITSIAPVGVHYAVTFGSVAAGKVETASVVFTSAKAVYTYVYTIMGTASGSRVVLNKVAVEPGQMYLVPHRPSSFSYRTGINEILSYIDEYDDHYELLFTEFTSLDPTYLTLAFFPKYFYPDRISLSSASVTASDNPGMHTYSGYPIEYIIDGNSGTRFASAGQKKNSLSDPTDYWFVIDFGSEKTFDYIESIDYKKNWKSWSFSTSSDGVTWTAVDPSTVACLYDNPISDKMKVQFLFENPLTTQYLKIHVMHDEDEFQKGDTFSVWDLSFYKLPEDSFVYVYEFELIPPGYIKPGDVDKKSPSYLQGQIDGYEAGFLFGKDLGYKNGYDEAKRFYTKNNLYQTGYDEGYAAARRDIVSVSDGNAISGFFQGVWSGLTAFVMPIMNGIGFTSVDGTFVSLGSVLTVVILLVVVGFVVMLFIK